MPGVRVVGYMGAQMKDRLSEIRERLADDVKLMNDKVERWSADRGEIHNRLDNSTDDREYLLSELDLHKELLRKQCNRSQDLTQALSIAKGALELVAAPKRRDGTYNRCREACEQLAREALARIGEGELRK